VKILNRPAAVSSKVFSTLLNPLSQNIDEMGRAIEKGISQKTCQNGLFYALWD